MTSAGPNGYWALARCSVHRLRKRQLPLAAGVQAADRVPSRPPCYPAGGPPCDGLCEPVTDCHVENTAPSSPVKPLVKRP